MCGSYNNPPPPPFPQDTDKVAHVPSTLTEPNVIAVGAIQSDGTVWPGSNTGLKSVDFAAPGVRVSHEAALQLLFWHVTSAAFLFGLQS